jgi:hypothetical protein
VDPDVDLAVGRKPKVTTGAVAGPQEPEAPAFVQPGLGSPRQWMIVGIVLLFCAMIAAAVNSPAGLPATQAAYRVMLTVYNTLMNTGMGVVALFIAARLLERPFGSVELAAGRMFAAVAAFMLIMSLSLRLTGVGFLDEVAGLGLAAAAYLLLVAWTFKLWSRVPLIYVAGAHLMLWLVMLVGMALSAEIKPGPPRPAGNSTPVQVTPVPSNTRTTPLK